MEYSYGDDVVADARFIMGMKTTLNTEQVNYLVSLVGELLTYRSMSVGQLFWYVQNAFPDIKRSELESIMGTHSLCTDDWIYEDGEYHALSRRNYR